MDRPAGQAVPPQVRNLTDYEKKTGWRYSITCTNIPDSGMGGVPGSHHPQYVDVVHREHACVETAGVRTAKAIVRRRSGFRWGESAAALGMPMGGGG